jgi:hypothetical protein
VAATVRIGSQRAGSTPLIEYQLAAGQYRIRVVPNDGRPPHEAPVTIRPNQTTIHIERW